MSSPLIISPPQYKYQSCPPYEKDDSQQDRSKKDYSLQGKPGLVCNLPVRHSHGTLLVPAGVRSKLFLETRRRLTTANGRIRLISYTADDGTVAALQHLGCGTDGLDRATRDMARDRCSESKGRDERSKEESGACHHIDECGLENLVRSLWSRTMMAPTRG